MSDSRSKTTVPKPTSLWWLTCAPLVWVAHFLATYATASVYCAKIAAPHGSAGTVRLLVAGYTAVAIGAITALARVGWTRHRLGTATLPHDAPTRADEVRLLGYAMFLLSVLSGVATVFTALVLVFIGRCL